jgi:hypothetical protein
MAYSDTCRGNAYYNHYRIWDYFKAMDTLLLNGFIQLTRPKLLEE